MAELSVDEPERVLDRIGMIVRGVAYQRTLGAKSHAKARYKDRERLAQVLIRSAQPDRTRRARACSRSQRTRFRAETASA
jgi:hypothetical protein